METSTIIILVAVGVLLSMQQLRYRRFGVRTLALPIVFAVVLWYAYVQGAPTIANDMDLYLICGAIGAALGVVGGVLSSVRRDQASGAWLVKGGAVKVTLNDGKLAFEFIEAAIPALPKPEGDGDEGGTAEREPEVVE